MQARNIVAAAGWALLPLFALADIDVTDESAEPEEIVVIGRAIATSSARIEVEREMLVDTATALRDVPGATVNRNGPITGIAQFRGMFGDRVAVGDRSARHCVGWSECDGRAAVVYVANDDRRARRCSRYRERIASARGDRRTHQYDDVARGEFGGESFGITGMIGTRYADNGGISTTAGKADCGEQSPPHVGNRRV